MSPQKPSKFLFLRKGNPSAPQILKELKGVKFDLVITLCNRTRGSCPAWPSQPVAAPWGSANPAALEGTADARRGFFVDVPTQIDSRIKILRPFRDDQLTACTSQRSTIASFSI